MGLTENPKATVLLVEDDNTVARIIIEALEASGYSVWHAENGADARAMLEQASPDLVVLDVQLPDTDGLVLVPKLKAAVDIPIILCSAVDEKRERVLGLKLGADDYIAKPFDLDEFEARIEAVLRRYESPKASNPGHSPEEIRVGELLIDSTRRRVLLGGHPIHLTPTEYRLLTALASRPDGVVSREELAQQVWGYEDASTSRTIDVHIRRLRGKLGQGPVPAPTITAVRGFGYQVETDEGLAHEDSLPGRLEREGHSATRT